MLSLPATALVLSLSLQSAPQIEEGTVIPADRYNVEILATDLEQPWNLSWLPSGDMLVTERSGDLRIIRDGEMLPTPVGGIPDLYVEDQSGLFEAEPHPDFAENNLLYLTYAAGTKRNNSLVLARGTFVETDEGGQIENLEVLFTTAPGRRNGYHYGGRIAWAEDGTLFLTSGEGYEYMKQAQSLDNHFGKVLRLTEDGTAAPGNPFEGQDDAMAEIWSYGHRNPQGIALTPEGTIYVNEHGPKGGDELNIITPGTNYGWPVITYGIDYSGAPITPFKEMEGMAQPLFHWTPSIAPSTLLYYQGTDFPEWQGMLMSGSLAYNHIRITDPENPAGEQWELLKERDRRIRDVAVGPDGALYATTENRYSPGGEVLRITPR
ncbi:MAG: PQQ-dependent sugar dehydrogenase [Pseudomonadota bacterium]